MRKGRGLSRGCGLRVEEQSLKRSGGKGWDWRRGLKGGGVCEWRGRGLRVEGQSMNRQDLRGRGLKEGGGA